MILYQNFSYYFNGEHAKKIYQNKNMRIRQNKKQIEQEIDFKKDSPSTYVPSYAYGRNFL